ncbi:aldehyde dehydrogenase family protein [Streptomyces sp. CWNU-52H]
MAAGRKLLLELGGNDPLFVLPDTDLAAAARLASDGACATAGAATAPRRPPVTRWRPACCGPDG